MHLRWSCETWVVYGSQQVTLTDEKQVGADILQGLPRRTISLQEVSFPSLQDQGFNLQTKASAFRKEPQQVPGVPLLLHNPFYPREKS